MPNLFNLCHIDAILFLHNMQKMCTLCIKYAQYAKNMPKIGPDMQNMPKICKTYAQYAKNVQKYAKQYAQYAKHMQRYAKYAQGTLLIDSDLQLHWQ